MNSNVFFLFPQILPKLILRSARLAYFFNLKLLIMTTLRKFRTQFNYENHDTSGEVNTGKSMTVPDMAMSLRQLLDHHTRGMAMGHDLGEGEYFEDEVVPRPDESDLIDIFERKFDVNERSRIVGDAVEQELRSIKTKKQQAEKEKREFEAFQASRKASPPSSPPDGTEVPS